MKKPILLPFLILILSAVAYGQETTEAEMEYATVPVNASLLPGVLLQVEKDKAAW